MTNQPQAETRFADVNGARIAYDVTGSGFPLVLVHAGVASRRMWDPQVAAFAEHVQVIRYDMRGYGETALPSVPYAHRRDLVGLLQTLGVERAYLLGCSMGGTTVIDVALEHPELVAALIPVASGPSGYKYEGPVARQWDELVAAYRAGDLARASELEVEIWVDGPQRTPDQVPAGIRQQIYEMNLIALKNESTAEVEPEPLDPPAVGRLGDIRAPTLVISTDLDQPVVLETSAYLAQHIPGAQHALIRGAAHLPSMEHPDEFNRIVLAFLRGL